MKQRPDFSHLKRTPYAGVPNVEEIEQPDGHRCLAPTEKWTTDVASTRKGEALAGLYLVMTLMGVPSHVILTIAAVKFADENKKIDYQEWIKNRSNWSAEDKEGAITVLEIVEQKATARTKTSAFETLPPVKKPEDDWNLN